MSDQKKSIIISKDFLGGSSKTKKRKPKINNLMKGVSMKKKLLENVKKHHSKTLKSTLKNNKPSNYNNYSSNNQEINSFDESLDYLDKVLKQKKKKKEQELQQKLEREREQQNQMQNQMQNQEVTLAQIPVSSISHYHPKDHIGTNVSVTLKKAPPYGILKNGKKPTYRQFKQTLSKNQTLKTLHGGEKKYQPLNIENNVNTVSPFVKERKDKLKSYIQNYNINNKPKKNKKKIIIREKKIKTTRKLGKNKSKVGILVKGDKTRKKIKSELEILKQVPLYVIKKYLKKRDLIKAGTNAPERVLRQIYEDTILSGDIYNKNSDVLIHNYFNEKNEL